MATLSTAGIDNGSVIQPEHITSIINALNGTTATDITITGTLSTTGLSMTGSLSGTASYALQAANADLATLASTATTATSASLSNFATTSSYALSVTSASYALTASYALNGGGSGTTTGSFTGSFTGSVLGSINTSATEFVLPLSSPASIKTGSMYLDTHYDPPKLFIYTGQSVTGWYSSSLVPATVWP